MPQRRTAPPSPLPTADHTVTLRSVFGSFVVADDADAKISTSALSVVVETKQYSTVAAPQINRADYMMLTACQTEKRITLKVVSAFGSTDYERGTGRLDFEYPTDGDG